LNKGLEEEYILPRIDRARKYADKHRKSVSDVLLEWREKDGGVRKTPSLPQKRRSESFSDKALEAQAWFDAMVNDFYGANQTQAVHA